MTITPDSTLRYVAFEVCTALQRVGVVAVLTGGGAATLWAPQAIQSFDLDFVLTLHPAGVASARALEELGYQRRGADYIHDRSRFQLEFPPGPLAIGGERIRSWESLQEGDRVLHVISPTDSCRDRLAAFFHFRDRSALEQAFAVHASQSCGVQLDAIEAWGAREGHAESCREFLERVRGRA